MTVYMAVTTDKYELPIAVEDKAADLARKMGVTPNSLYCGMSLGRSGKNRNFNFIKVEIDEEE